ncbi:Hypp8592 [Branchiostoma lanceolatum]|uniref:Hypp8592 protein n=1 Tax=Branchiostoma lanceolatum TaxID=7740 RepID=A0A8J9Z7N4_BRALA|nr:Hypp8592 [Branchiostoma lanceolatum]
MMYTWQGYSRCVPPQGHAEFHHCVLARQAGRQTIHPSLATWYCGFTLPESDNFKMAQASMPGVSPQSSVSSVGSAHHSSSAP